MIIKDKNYKKSKLFTAIEVVFIIFIMVVVVLVVVHLVTQYTNPKKVEPIVESLQEFAKETYMREICNKLCSEIKSSGEENRLNLMARWCLKKITDRGKDYIDLVEDGIPGFYVVNGYPYCEAGTYCFHHYECNVGGIILNMRTCRTVLCEYFFRIEGNPSKATQNIRNVFDWGRCSIDPNEILKRGKSLLRRSPNWWYNEVFINVEPDDFCKAIIEGREIIEVSEESTTTNYIYKLINQTSDEQIQCTKNLDCENAFKSSNTGCVLIVETPTVPSQPQRVICDNGYCWCI
ncbi:MAG: hypothetical protein QW409_03650 [Candidatus Aenigmatarchaeota archaeon]